MNPFANLNGQDQPMVWTIDGLDPLPDEAVKKMLATRKMLGITTRNTLENQCGR